MTILAKVCVAGRVLLWIVAAALISVTLKILVVGAARWGHARLLAAVCVKEKISNCEQDCFIILDFIRRESFVYNFILVFSLFYVCA